MNIHTTFTHIFLVTGADCSLHVGRSGSDKVSGICLGLSDRHRGCSGVADTESRQCYP